MSWYKDKKNEWKQIIETVARYYSRSEAMVEKDIIQSMFLYELSKTNLPLVFKGGTSLSKAFQLIERFSEDIDLSSYKKMTTSAKKKAYRFIIEVGNRLGLNLTNKEMVKSGHDYNQYVFEYESLFFNRPLNIIVETNYYLTVYPIERHKIYNFVATFRKENNASMPFEFEALSFEMNVQTLERTFIDKVFAVCDYYLQNMEDRDSRHLYDIYKMMEHIDFDEDLKRLMVQVRKDRMASKNNPSADIKYNIRNLLKEIIDKHFYEKDFNSLTKKLLYEDIGYATAIEKGIGKLIDLDIF